MPQLLSLCSRSQEPQLLKPSYPTAHAVCNKRNHSREVCPQQLGRSSGSPQRERSSCSNEDPAQTNKKKRNESLTPIKEVELTHSDRKEISGPFRQAVGRYGREGSQTGRRKFLLKVMNMFTTLIVVTVTWVYTYTKK